MWVFVVLFIFLFGGIILKFFSSLNEADHKKRKKEKHTHYRQIFNLIGVNDKFRKKIIECSSSPE